MISRIAITITSLLFCVAATKAEVFSSVSSKPTNVSFKANSGNEFEISVAKIDIEHETVNVGDEKLDLFTIADEPLMSREGWPDLPVIVRTIIIPPTGNAEVIMKKISTNIQTGISPVPAPAPDRDDYSNASYSRSLRSLNGFWPPDPVEIGDPAILRGNRILLVRIFPIQYNPTTGETKFNDNIEFGITFSGHGKNEVINPGRLKPSKFTNKLLESMALNPPQPTRDDILEGSYLYIIPRVNGVENAMAPLLNWRRRMGHRVATALVNNNAAAGAIGDIIQNAYDSDDPPEFVCLVGDAASSDIIVPAPTQTGDYEYTKLDGDDPLPDVAIGRMTVADLNQLNHVVQKIISYETTPYMDDTEWYRRGAVVAGHQGNGLGEILLAKWVKKELIEYGFNEVLDWFWDVDGEIGDNQPFLTNSFREGISILHYRAYSHMNLIPLQVITDLPNDEGRWPAVLAISCNTGNFVADQNGNYRNIGLSEEFFRANGGGIGAIGTATPETNVRFNNLVAGGVWLGVYRYEQYCLGWGLVTGKYQIWQAYEGHDNEYLNFMDWNNLMGDPGTSIWTDVPMLITVEHLDNIPIGTTRFDVYVENDAENTPLGNAQVCLWKGDELHAVEVTDTDGQAHFNLPQDELSAGVMKLTVVKHNVYPYLADVNIGQPQVLLGIDSFTLDEDNQGESSGDGDGIVNGGETVELRIALKNLGQAGIQGGVTLSASSLSEWAEIIDGPENLNQAPAPGQSVTLTYMVQLSPACPDLETIRIPLDIQNGQNRWAAMAQFEVRSPKVEIKWLEVEGDSLVQGQVKHLNLMLTNVGGKELPASNGTINFSSPLISAINSVASFPSIPAGDSATVDGDLYRILAHPYATPGSVTTLSLQVETEGGFVDQTTHPFSLGAPGARDPFGPDYYGYICYDSGDNGWIDAPAYSWVEIANNGSRLNLSDQGDNQDRSIVVNLPFAVNYYGQQFNRITVCTNGWAAFGEQADLANFRNQHIGQALCPNAMLCPWWDNLIIPNGGGIFTRFDQQAGRFVIQWNNVQRLVEGANGSSETFEIVIYNQQVRPTRTGDAEILFQYRDIDNQNARAHNDIPFCTIGITGLDGLDGLEYTYWSEYVPGARTIADQMAIRFTTGSPFVNGAVEGTITDAATGEHLSDALVIAPNGFWARSNNEGFYRIDNILAANNVTLTASKDGYNDSTLSGLQVVQNEALRVDFNLIHPEFLISRNQIDRRVILAEDIEIPLTISNQGNGSLEWATTKKVDIENAPRPWQLVSSLHIGQTANDDRIEGAVLVGDRIYAAGANGVDPSVVYVFNRDGEVLDEWPQQGQSNFGMKDLEWDGEWIWGGEDDTMFAYTPDGELMTHWKGPFNPNNAVAWDPDREVLWIANTTRNIEAFTRQGQRTGQVIRRLNDGIFDWRIYGLAYNPEDPAGKCLYVLHRPTGETNRWLLFRVNPDEGVPEFFHEIYPPEGGQTSGISITSDLNPLCWTMLAIANASVAQGRDRLDIYNIQTRTEWMKLEPNFGTISSGQSDEISLTLRCLNLPIMDVQGEIIFDHNASEGKTILPVSMHIVEAQGNFEDQVWHLEQGWNNVSLNLDPPDRSIPNLVAPLVQTGNLLIMKDGAGRFYRPAAHFNNLPDFNTANGYQLYVTDAVDLQLFGSPVPVDQPIALTQGWNLVGYYPNDALDVTTALRSLENVLILAKNAAGKFYLPAFNFNNMEPMEPGRGYQLKVRNDYNLVYPAGNRLAARTSHTELPTYFKAPDLSAESFSLLVLADEPATAGWEIAVLNGSDEIAGVGRFDEQGRCGVAVWGVEESNSNGLNTGEQFKVKVWNTIEESDASLEPVTGELAWSQDGFAVGKLNVTKAFPVEFNIESAYPNPFNAQVKLTYGLSQTGAVRLSALDISGREIAQIVNGQQNAGRHAVTWNAGLAPSGVYLFRLESSGAVKTIKATLMK